MVGLSHRIQVRHILVDKEEVAALLKETVDSVKTETGRIKMVMSLAGKYSQCATREDGGNLGWIELRSDDPRPRIEGHHDIAYPELEKIIRQGVRNLQIVKGVLFGPVKTSEGYHLVMVCNEFGADHATEF